MNTMSAAVSQVPNRRRVRNLHGAESIDTTLLELIQAIAEETDDDREIVATVLHLLHSGRVRLAGNFRGLRIEAAGEPLTGPA
jgi:hypothetical protein